eukprot:1951276-Rhodomonas_salina.2
MAKFRQNAMFGLLCARDINGVVNTPPLDQAYSEISLPHLRSSSSLPPIRTGKHLDPPPCDDRLAMPGADMAPAFITGIRLHLPYLAWYHQTVSQCWASHSWRVGR